MSKMNSSDELIPPPKKVKWNKIIDCASESDSENEVISLTKMCKTINYQMIFNI